MKSIRQILILLLFSCSYCFAQNTDQLNPFSDIGENSLKSFSGTNLIFHGTGIASTYILINSGLDYKIHNYFVQNGYSPFFDPAVGIGYLMPVVLGGGLYLYGELDNKSKETAAGSAVVQAGLISVAYSTLLKAFTGRSNPHSGSYENNNASKEFQFGFMRGGIHYGWPSGHLCTNTAIVSSLIFFYKESTTIKIAGCLYLGYIFFGVIAHENNTMHWFSDTVAGFLMGYAIGSTVGKNFRNKWDEGNKCEINLTQHTKAGFLQFYFEKDNAVYNLSPVITPDYQGVHINISF
jgi:membrane-associated phospholipid phosphatase